MVDTWTAGIMSDISMITQKEMVDKKQTLIYLIQIQDDLQHTNLPHHVRASFSQSIATVHASTSQSMSQQNPLSPLPPLRGSSSLAPPPPPSLPHSPIHHLDEESIALKALIRSAFDNQSELARDWFKAVRFHVASVTSLETDLTTFTTGESYPAVRRKKYTLLNWLRSCTKQGRTDPYPRRREEAKSFVIISSCPVEHLQTVKHIVRTCDNPGCVFLSASCSDSFQELGFGTGQRQPRSSGFDTGGDLSFDPVPHPPPARSYRFRLIRRLSQRINQISPFPFSLPTWEELREGGPQMARSNFEHVFSKVPEDFVHKRWHWLDLGFGDCESFERVVALARLLATDTPVEGWNGQLHLNNNFLDDDAVEVLAEALKISRLLTTLNLKVCGINNEGASKIAQALNSNKALTCLSISGNVIGVVQQELLRQAWNGRTKDFDLLTLEEEV
eukprot:m.271312 g.271312  ORF g.271312 m.271312 type:complete len:446 (+) comp94408_c0_seq1:177-1514(+)